MMTDSGNINCNIGENNVSHVEDTKTKENSVSGDEAFETFGATSRVSADEYASGDVEDVDKEKKMRQAENGALCVTVPKDTEEAMPQDDVLPQTTLQEQAPNDDVSEPTIDPSLQQYAMELNVALEALETMRRVNLEVEFSTAASSLPSSVSSPALTVHHDQCTYCQREALQKFMMNPTPHTEGSDVNNGGFGERLRQMKLDGSRIRRFRGRFLSKATSNSDVQTDGSEDSNNNPNTFHATESCLPKLCSPSNQSLSTMGSDDEKGNGETANNPHNNASRKKMLQRKSTPRPCLTCGHPTCGNHTSPTFSTYHIPLCQPCAYLFELDFIVDVITQASNNGNMEECRHKVNDMIDCYDRAKLILTFTSQYTDDIAKALQSRKVTSNKIGASSSATGIVSGITGVVGCGALLFPPVAAVGVPLLIASLVFGGGATAAQTGDALNQKYFSEPRALADKMVSLHGMALSLLRIVEVLSYSLLHNHLNVNEYLDEEDQGSASRRDALANDIRGLLEKHGVVTSVGVGALKTAVVGSAVAAEVAVAAEASVLSASTLSTGASTVARNSRFFGRIGTTAGASLRFVPVAGGLLSAACIAVEGKELRKTLAQINDGNPCAKAEQILSIRDELNMLPDSSLIAGECHRVFVLAEKQKLKKAALVGSGDEQDMKDDVTHGDISSLIDSMETNATADT